MRNDRPDPIDALIDDAARAMVAGEPSSSVRGIVRSRIERGRPLWSFVPALAGVCALILAVFVGRAMIAPADRNVGRALSGSPGAPDKARPTIDETALPTPERVQFTPPRADNVPVPQPEEEEPPIPPIAIEPLTTVQIVVDVRSGVMPIEIEPLQIEPLLSE